MLDEELVSVVELVVVFEVVDGVSVVDDVVDVVGCELAPPPLEPEDPPELDWTGLLAGVP